MSDVPQSDKPQGTYVPLTEKEVEEWSAHLLSNWQLPLTKQGAAVLCDMAISSLRYAEEIQRLRDTSRSSVATNDQVLRAALEKIERWFGEFPPTGKFWNEHDPVAKREMSYGACFGSNGERDYMRSVARKALDLSSSSAPSATAVHPDTARLDFIERMGRNSNWVARHSNTGRGYRLHNDKDGIALSARAAIDMEMKKLHEYVEPSSREKA